jgi:hypothetical protein
MGRVPRINRRPFTSPDCSQHAEGAALTHDAQRTAYLNSRGYRVLRFWNCDVMENRDGVVKIIVAAVKTAPPARLRRATLPRLRLRLRRGEFASHGAPKL